MQSSNPAVLCLADMKRFGHDRLELVEELLGLMARDQHSPEVRTAARIFLLFSSQG